MGYSEGPTLALHQGVSSVDACMRTCCASPSCKSIAFLEASKTAADSSNECWTLPRYFQENFNAEAKRQSDADPTSGDTGGDGKRLPSMPHRPYTLASLCEGSGGADCEASILSCSATQWPLSANVVESYTAQLHEKHVHELRIRLKNTGHPEQDTMASKANNSLTAFRVVSAHPVAFRVQPSFDAPTRTAGRTSKSSTARPGQVLHASEHILTAGQELDGNSDAVLWIRIDGQGWLPTAIDAHVRRGTEQSVRSLTQRVVLMEPLDSNPRVLGGWGAQLSSFCINTDSTSSMASPESQGDSHCDVGILLRSVSWVEAAHYCTDWVHHGSASQDRRGGSRLCSAAELSSIGHVESSCPVQQAHVWTSTPCGAGKHFAYKQQADFRPHERLLVCLDDDDAVGEIERPIVFGGRCCADAIPLLPNVETLLVDDDVSLLSSFPSNITIDVRPPNADDGGQHSIHFRRLGFDPAKLKASPSTQTTDMTTSVPLQDAGVANNMTLVLQPCTLAEPCGLDSCLKHVATAFPRPFPTHSLGGGSHGEHFALETDDTPLVLELQQPTETDGLLPGHCRIGSHVQALFRGNLRWYSAKIAAIDVQSRTVTVDWDDGDIRFREVPNLLTGAAAVRECNSDAVDGVAGREGFAPPLPPVAAGPVVSPVCVPEEENITFAISTEAGWCGVFTTPNAPVHVIAERMASFNRTSVTVGGNAAAYTNVALQSQASTLQSAQGSVAAPATDPPTLSQVQVLFRCVLACDNFR